MITQYNDIELRPSRLVAELVEKFGPRPAGSQSEQDALQWVAEKLSEKYACSLETFSFAPQPAFLPYYSLVGIFFLVSALLLPDFPWLGIVSFGVVIALPDLSDWVTRRLPKRARSSNLWVTPKECEISELNLLLVAHIDTARVIPSGYGAALFDPLRRQVFPAMQRTAVILAFLALVSLLGIQLGPGVAAAAVTVTAVVALALTGLDIWDQRGAKDQFSAGANDNASGVGVLVALAEQLDLASFQHMKIGFLFTGAEEAGLWGAHSAARRLAETGARPVILCVDMVGAGETVRIVQGRRTIFRVSTNAEINAILERANPLAVAHWALRRSSDFEAFAKAGIPAAWVESSGTPESWRAYHTRRDQLDRINAEALDRAYTMLLRAVELMEHNQFTPRGSR